MTKGDPKRAKSEYIINPCLLYISCIDLSTQKQDNLHSKLH